MGNRSFRPKVVSHTDISPTPQSRFTQIRSCFAHRLGQKNQNEFKYVNRNINKSPKNASMNLTSSETNSIAYRYIQHWITKSKQSVRETRINVKMV